MTRKLLAMLAAFGLLAQDAAFAGQTKSGSSRQVEIAWEELAALAVEQRVAAVLPDGVKLQGEVLAVRPESLVLDVQKTSVKRLHPLGQTEIPRSSVSELTIIRERNAVMRIVGGILGAIGGLAAVTGLVYVTESLAVLLPALILGVPMAAAAGYYAGKLADRSMTTIHIRPGLSGDSFEEEL